MKYSKIEGQIFILDIILGHNISSMEMGIVSLDLSMEIGIVSLDFMKTILPSIMRPIALEKIKLHKGEGDKVVVVTASLDSWVKAWCELYEIESICSKLEIKEGLITGKLTGRDCICDEKVTRIKAKYNLNDYNKVFAYDDSYRDKEMLDIADVAYHKWEKQKS